MNRAPLLFLNVLIIAVCGLVYELLAGTLASYVLGDSVTQFSLIIGIYLSAMGAGAWLSGFLDKGLARIFVEVQLGVALLGGLSAPLLFLSFSKFTQFQLVLYPLVFAIGTLVGLEIPLLMRILKDLLDFKSLVARVLAFDYIGALVASLLFPLFLVPRLGLVRTSLLTGLLNAAVGLWSTWLLQPLIKSGLSALRARAAVVIVLLIIGVIKADRLTSLAEDNLFADPIVYAKQSAYQRMIVTRNRAGFQLFLNGHLQFSSTDEYRYHEALVHPAMIAATQNQSPRRVMILGGGDGLALREVLRHPAVEAVTLVDLDPEVTRLAANFPLLTELNQNSIRDARVKVINQDAMIWLEDLNEKFDAAIIDFPDPNSFALGKLYTTRFYRLLKSRLNDHAAVAVQSTSPLFARTSYWCIVRTMEAAGFFTHPYHLAVPSFGEWGFVLAKAAAFEAPASVPESLSTRLRFLNADSLKGMFLLPADLGPVPVEINRLDNQALVRYYESEWKRYQ